MERIISSKIILDEKLHHLDEIKWGQRSKKRWLLEGDSNTKKKNIGVLLIAGIEI